MSEVGGGDPGHRPGRRGGLRPARRLTECLRTLAGCFPARGRYQNLDPAHRPHGPRAILKWGLLDPLTGRRQTAPPGPPAPRLATAPGESPPAPAGDSLTWLGHAGFLGSLAGRRFLVDPVLSRRIGWLYRSHQTPALTPEELPPVDLLLITHNHYDHLDGPTVLALDHRAPAVVPAGLGRWFRRRGRPVQELRWWQSVEIADLRITLVPARHWSRRSILDTNRSWWGGFVLEGGGRCLYFAGDSAWFDGFAEIGRRFPDLEVAALPIGAYEPRWFMSNNHLDPEEAGRAFLAVGAHRLVPAHWGMFQLTDEPLAEPIERLRRWWRSAGPTDGRRLEVLAVGESLALDRR